MFIRIKNFIDKYIDKLSNRDIDRLIAYLKCIKNNHNNNVEGIRNLL